MNKVTDILIEKEEKFEPSYRVVKLDREIEMTAKLKLALIRLEEHYWRTFS